MTDNSRFRFGSAGFASAREIARAGMFDQSASSLLVGFLGNKPIWYDGAGGLVLVAGARSGKLRDVLAYNICAGIHSPTMVLLDMKGELTAVAQNQTPDQKFNICWNPAKLHGLPQHRINPVDYLRIDSRSLVADTKVFCENIIPLSGSAQSEFFERRAQEYLEAIILPLVQLNGVLTLPDLYHAVNLIPGESDEYLDFAFEMSKSPFEISVRVEEEIANSRKDTTGGFQGIMGELFKGLSCLSDPQLMASVSPPYDFSLSQLCESDQTYLLSIMPPAEFIDSWAPIIKALFVSAMMYKARAPHAPRQTWVIDECSQLGKFPLIVKAFTYAAGIGIRPWAVFQSAFQMRALGPDAENIITSSAQLRSYFGVRDIETASAVSRMIGHETLQYFDETQSLRASHAKRQALHAVMNGQDPFAAALQCHQQSLEASTMRKQQRLLRTPDEVLNMPGDKQFIFTDGIPHPIYADRKPYYEQVFMRGRYHPNPYHPPAGKVRVKMWMGHSWRKVISEPVPERYAHYPQYQGGLWSRIEE